MGNPSEPIDLRSDTVTRPDAAMREAIAGAEVGDAVLGDDPTTERLEDLAARLLDKERALFFPSGIMANQAALLVLGRPGSEGLAEKGSHVLHYEEAAAAALGGLQLRPVQTPDGLLTPQLLAGALRPASPFLPETRVLVVENTHLDSGGTVMPLEVARGLRRVAEEAGLAIHLDGARLWNAAAARGHPPAAWCREADTVMVSLSKGLGAPVGSLLAGASGAMERAWRVRRRLGGGMRQTGLLAAAAIHALEQNLPRIREDHRRARELATRLRPVPGLRVVPPETNILLLELEDGLPDSEIVAGWIAAEGVLVVPFGRRRIRAVTHLDVDDGDVERAAEAIRRVLGRGSEA